MRILSIFLPKCGRYFVLISSRIKMTTRTAMSSICRRSISRPVKLNLVQCIAIKIIRTDESRWNFSCLKWHVATLPIHKGEPKPSASFKMYITSKFPFSVNIFHLHNIWSNEDASQFQAQTMGDEQKMSRQTKTTKKTSKFFNSSLNWWI